MPVEVVHWNPRRPLLGNRLRVLSRMNNFGDLLGPVIVSRLLRNAGIDAGRQMTASSRLLAVGSIIKLAKTNDTVWGAGVNGKSIGGRFDFENLNVRAVRGPLTREFLLGRGVEVPEVYGDPGLLVGHLWSRDVLSGDHKRGGVAVVPNFHDYPGSANHPGLVNPQDDLWSVVGRIAASDLVVGSSLHGVVVAESLGIPARLVRSSSEPIFKYQDYYAGTGRREFTPAESVEEAVDMGGEVLPHWDPSALLNSFPYDLW